MQPNKLEQSVAAFYPPFASSEKDAEALRFDQLRAQAAATTLDHWPVFLRMFQNAFPDHWVVDRTDDSIAHLMTVSSPKHRGDLVLVYHFSKLVPAFCYYSVDFTKPMKLNQLGLFGDDRHARQWERCWNEMVPAMVTEIELANQLAQRLFPEHHLVPADSLFTVVPGLQLDAYTQMDANFFQLAFGDFLIY